MRISDEKVMTKRGNNALQLLRKSKLSNGLPFMINSTDLPDKQCYLEYSDGRIFLVSIIAPTDRNFTTIRELSALEKITIREKFDLI